MALRVNAMASSVDTRSDMFSDDKLARDFIELGTAKGLDASCVEGIRRLPFVTSLPVLPMPK